MPRLPLKLPNAERARVDRSKVVEYLLNAAHPRNAGKAKFFESLGFSFAAPEQLIDALRRLASGDATERVETVHGDTYVVEALLTGRTATSPARMVRTVWIVDLGQEAPRLVTAYPLRR